MSLDPYAPYGGSTTAGGAKDVVTEKNAANMLYIKGDKDTLASYRLSVIADAVHLQVKSNAGWEDKAQLGGSISTDFFNTDQYGGGLFYRKNGTHFPLLVAGNHKAIELGNVDGELRAYSKSGEIGLLSPKFVDDWYYQQDGFAETNNSLTQEYTFTTGEPYGFGQIRFRAKAGVHYRIVVEDNLGNLLYQSGKELAWDIDNTTFPTTVAGVNTQVMKYDVTIPTDLHSVKVKFIFSAAPAMQGKTISGAFQPYIGIFASVFNQDRVQKELQTHDRLGSGDNIFETNKKDDDFFSNLWQDYTPAKDNDAGTISPPKYRAYTLQPAWEPHGKVGVDFMPMEITGITKAESTSIYTADIIPEHSYTGKTIFEIYYTKGTKGQPDFVAFDKPLLTTVIDVDFVADTLYQMHYRVPIEIAKGTVYSFRLLKAGNRVVSVRKSVEMLPYYKWHYRTYTDDNLATEKEAIQNAEAMKGLTDFVISVNGYDQHTMTHVLLEREKGGVFPWGDITFIDWITNTNAKNHVGSTVTSAQDTDLLLVHKANKDIAEISIKDMKNLLKPRQWTSEALTKTYTSGTEIDVVGLTHVAAIPSTYLISANIRVKKAAAKDVTFKIKVGSTVVERTRNIDINSSDIEEQTVFYQTVVTTTTPMEIIQMVGTFSNDEELEIRSSSEGRSAMRVISMV